MIRDRNINYKYQSLYLPAQSFDKLTNFTDAGDAADDLIEVGTTGLLGWKFDGGDDQIYITMTTPNQIDWDNSVFYRVIWAIATASDLTLTDTFALSASETAFGALPAVSAPTAFTSVTDTPSAISVVLATPWAKTDSTTTDGVAGTSDMLRLYVDCTSDSANDPRLLGLEIKYLPKLTDGPQTNDQADPTDA